MTHNERIEDANMKALVQEGWGRRHYNAWMSAKVMPCSAICELINYAAKYADGHRERYGSCIGDDGVLGEHWRDIVKGIQGLLNGETGDLDCGTVDKLLNDMLAAEGLDE